MRTQNSCNVLDDPHQRELPITLREPRIKWLGRMLCAVTGNMNPVVVSECLNGAFYGCYSPSNGLECHRVRRHVRFLTYYSDVVLYFWELA